MTYGLLFYETAAELAKRNSEDAPAYWGAWSAYIDLLADSGALVPGAGAGLQEPGTATTVRRHDERTLIQDGPIADVKEQLGGLVLVNVETLDKALDLAAKAPCALPGAGGVEVRPILPAPGA